MSNRAFHTEPWSQIFCLSVLFMLMQSLHLKLSLSKNLGESSCLSFLRVEACRHIYCTLIGFLRTESGPSLAFLKPLCLQHPGGAGEAACTWVGPPHPPYVYRDLSQAQNGRFGPLCTIQVGSPLTSASPSSAPLNTGYNVGSVQCGGGRKPRAPGD